MNSDNDKDLGIEALVEADLIKRFEASTGIKSISVVDRVYDLAEACSNIKAKASLNRVAGFKK